jgi:hypothetical protein
MATLIDNAEYTANEIYEIQQTDPVEGAGAGASFGGIGISNEPHQQLGNRTAFLYGRQNTNIASIAALQAFTAGFVGSLKTAGYLKIPLNDVSRGPMTAIIQWGYYALSQLGVANDTQFTVSWLLPFPNAILIPPLVTNVYYATAGANTAASVVSYNAAGATFVLDVPGALMQRAGLGNEQSNGFSWLAIGF